LKKEFDEENEWLKVKYQKDVGVNRIGDNMTKDKLCMIDLFAGIGGIRLGFEGAGFKCVFSSEINKHCIETYKANFGEVPYGDITKLDANIVPNHEVLTAGFPCQPFSICGHQKGFDDTRGTLFYDILRVLKAKKPSAVMLENVGHLKYHNKGKTLKTILRHLAELGYKVDWQVLNAKDFGVPQNRERIFIIGSQKRFFDFDKLEKTHGRPIESILEESGNFEYLQPEEYTLIETPRRQKSGLVFVGYRNKSIRKVGVRPNTNHLSRAHKQPNRIYSAKGTHPTLTSQEPTGRFFILHNGRVRKLTITECFRLMGFPEHFKKVAPKAELYKQAGNSVAVTLIEELAREIKRQFFFNYKEISRKPTTLVVE